MTCPEPTAYTPDLIRFAHHALARIYRPGFRYRKAGVMLGAIQPATLRQGDLFVEVDHGGNAALMEAVDAINGRWGRGTVFFAASGTGGAWATRQVMTSPRYTTRWEDVPSVRG